MKQLFKDKKWWLETLKIATLGIIINIACLFICSITGHCANIDDMQYPYYINEIYGANGIYGNNTIQTDDVNGVYHKYFQSQEDLIKSFLYEHGVTTSDVVIIRVNEVYNGVGVGTGYFKLALWAYVNPTNSVILADNSSFLNSSVLITAEKVIKVDVSYYLSSNTFAISSSGTLTSGTALSYNLFGTPSIYHFNATRNGVTYEGYQIYNYPLLMMGTNVYYTSNNIPVIAFIGVSVGDFTELPPLEDILNNISENYTPHTNNTPPTYDSNLSDGENISNAITGHSNNMNNAINNLGENIKNFFNKLYEKLTNVGNKISQNIYNGFSTLMQNIKDFFGPKLDSINEKLGQLVDHISQNEEESQQEIQTALHGTTFYQDFDDMKGLVSDSFSIWNITSAPSEYKIPFHVERITILNCEKVQYIDLSLFSPVFPYLRGVMWALVTYSLVYTVIDSIASYISGGDE